MSTDGGLFGGSWSELTEWLRGKPKETERRNTNRVPVHDIAELSWASESGLSRSTTVNLVDASEFGFKIRCPEEIPVGVAVELTDSNGKSATGSIIYSAPDEDAFIIGAQATWESAENSSAESAA